MQEDGMVQPDVHRLHHLTSRPAMPLPYVHLAPGFTALVGGCGLWVGEGIEETAGAAARVIVGDGQSAPPLIEMTPFTLSALQSRNDFFPSHGIAFYRGLMVQTTAGATRGTIFAVLLTREELDFLVSARSGMRR